MQAIFKFIKGDIFSTRAQALVNPVNCMGISGRGLARLCKMKYPTNQASYENACHLDKLKPGTLLVTKLNSDFNPNYIVNFPTKDDWKHDSKIEYIELGLDKLRLCIIQLKLESIAIPALGCGLGNLDWKVVKQLIINKLTDMDNVIVEIYEPI